MTNSQPLNPGQTVASVVLDYSECAPVFQKYRIDYCCKGEVSIEEASAQRGLETEELIAELSQAIASRLGSREDDPRALPTSALIAHIISKHHVYLRETLPFVEKLAQKVALVHGPHNARLVELQEVVATLFASLIAHIDEEEQVLFPALMSKTPDPQLLAGEFDAMKKEHLAVGALLEKMRDATEDYLIPKWACTSYRTLFSELEAIERDTLTHVHLETHALMPRFEAA
jgi:regulator of cell morphogenesis and NO signaling